MEINITVPGEPVPQGRPKFSTIGGHARAYDPKKSVDYKKLVSRYAMQHKPATLLDGALEVQILIFKPMLKGFSKKKAEQAEARLIRPTTKPDADNYAKGPMDALKGIIWKDDGQVVDLVARKFYSANPRIEITVKTLDNQQIELI
jgi:Holliday junction resolvase RusA-like endonuclease